MGCSKSNSKREVYGNTILSQETIKESNRQPNSIPKTTGKWRKSEKNKQTPKSAEGKIIKIREEINEREMMETIAKINKTKSWFFEKINKIDKPLARLIKKTRGEKSDPQN